MLVTKRISNPAVGNGQMHHESLICKVHLERGCSLWRSQARLLIIAVLVLFAALISKPTHASLTCNPVNVSASFTAGIISVPANTAVGATVNTQSPYIFQLKCYFPAESTSLSAMLYADFKTTAALAPGFNDVYQTGVAGLGIRYTFSSPDCNVGSTTLADGALRLSCPFKGAANTNLLANATVTTTLIRTGALAPGGSSLTSVPTVTIAFTTSDGGSACACNQLPLYTGSASGTLSIVTCSVIPPPPVDLPTVTTTAFSSGVGAVAGTRDFSLSLNCMAGAKVWITFRDNSRPTNRSNTLELTPDSTAQGVGIQLLNSTGPVFYGEDSAIAGGVNQWFIGDSPDGLMRLPMSAQYIRTGTVQAGSVTGLSTFTMSYQ